jgi:20S proteasome alpha/beta subunit
VRPFGVSSILAGFGADGKPQVYQIDPSGTYFSWKANAIGGKNSKGMREFLEKEWTEGLDERAALKLTVKTLLEVECHPRTDLFELHIGVKCLVPVTFGSHLINHFPHSCSLIYALFRR